MIDLKKLMERSGSFCIELKKEDYELFNRWCESNWLFPLFEYSEYVFIKHGFRQEIRGFFDHEEMKGLWHYRFFDMKEDRLIPFKSADWLVEFEIPQEETFLPYGRKGIVLPVLDRPADINKLYKGINKDREWASPDIFYLGNQKEAEELKRHFGISELVNKEHQVSVYCNAELLEDIRKDYEEGKDIQGYDYWRNVDGVPYPCTASDVLDSIIIADPIDYYMIRSLDPRAVIYRNVCLGNNHTKPCIQVALHSKRFEEKVMKLLEYLKFDNYYIIRKGNTWKENSLARQPYNRRNYCGVNFVTSYIERRSGMLNVDISRRNEVGHILFVALQMTRQKYPFLKEIDKGAGFTIITKQSV